MRDTLSMEWHHFVMSVIPTMTDPTVQMISSMVICAVNTPAGIRIGARRTLEPQAVDRRVDASDKARNRL